MTPSSTTTFLILDLSEFHGTDEEEPNCVIFPVPEIVRVEELLSNDQVRLSPQMPESSRLIAANVALTVTAKANVTVIQVKAMRLFIFFDKGEKVNQSIKKKIQIQKKNWGKKR